MMKALRKVCVVTGSRAEYGLLYWLLKEIDEAPDLELQLVTTGMHLSPEFGLTYQQIEADGFSITKKVDMLMSSDSSSGIAKSMGLGMIGFADAFESLQPDIVLMLGDRFELLSAASAALVAALPIAHIHGGEVTTGAFDEAIRHSITKMSQLHFTATETYRQRVIQLGEHPNTVFNVGALGLENIRRLELLNRDSFEEFVGIPLGERSLLVTWHPVTLKPGRSATEFQILLDVLDELKDVNVVFTKANADTEGRIINNMIDDYVENNSTRTVAYTSLGQLRYLSALSHVDGVVGNSSSGIIEAPSLFVGTVNIGERQRGRLKAASIIDCNPDQNSISSALAVLFSNQFQKQIKEVDNPYDVGESPAARIVQTLRSCNLKGIVEKKFFDLCKGNTIDHPDIHVSN